MICVACRTGIYYLVTSAADEWNSETQQVHHQECPSFEAAIKDGCYICSKYHASLNPHNVENVATIWDGVGPLVFKGRRMQENARQSHWRFGLLAQADSGNNADRYWFDLYTVGREELEMSQLSSYVAPARTDDAAALSLLKGWLRCCDTHVLCQSSGAVLPTRLIDLQPNGLDDDHVRLVDTHAQAVVGKYTTLSHRWGGSRPSKLTVESQSEFMQGCLTSGLSPIYQDAIRITKFLGIRYLWIDSLCVLQDQVDTKIEAGKMASVFENGYCNLAALPLDPNAMFTRRRHDVYTPTARLLLDDCKIDGRSFIINDSCSMKDEINSSPLIDRAWVLQELVLARRTIYFGGHQLMFNCLCSNASETHPVLRMPDEAVQYPWDHLDAPHYQSFRSPTMAAVRRRSSSKIDTPPSLRRIRAQSDSSVSSMESMITEADTEPLQEFLELVELYTLGKLSHIEDKPLAIAGIATQFGEQLHAKYTHGLWLQHLGACLLWQMRVSSVLTERAARRAHPGYLGPSWSWISVSGGVQFRKSPFPTGEAISRSTYHLEDSDVEHLATIENPYTTTRLAWIHLKVPTLPFVYDDISGFGFRILRPDSESDGDAASIDDHAFGPTNLITHHEDMKRYTIAIDVDQRPGYHHDISANWKFKAMFLRAYVSKPTPPNISVQLQGLVLVQHPPSEQNVKIPEHLRPNAYFRYCSFSVSFPLRCLSDKPEWMPEDWCLWDCSGDSHPAFAPDAPFADSIVLF